MSFKRTLSIVGLSSSLVGFASAEIESSISAGYNSQYVYRGVDLGDDQAHLSLAASGNAGDLDWNIGLFHGSSEGADILALPGALTRPGFMVASPKDSVIASA